jgi:23S rRNA pseudouridine1911/1915/1917 synthase
MADPQETPAEGQALHEAIVPAKGRLDKVLAEALPSLSRSRIKALIIDGEAAVDGHVVRDPAAKVAAGQAIRLAVPPPEPSTMAPEAIDLPIMHEDDDLLVIDKPAGLVVHPAPGNRQGTLVNALLAHCAGQLSGIGGVTRPGIVHRLDKDTSGLMVVAKNDAAHAGLKEQFADRTLSRTYQAIVRGVPWPRQGEVDAPIGRHPTHRRKMAVVERGKLALTIYRVDRTFGERASLVTCRLATGRTHQIRVHMDHIGHPLVGDPLYGRGQGAGLRFHRQALHAARLAFTHPATSQPMSFESQLPLDIMDLCDSLESK